MSKATASVDYNDTALSSSNRSHAPDGFFTPLVSTPKIFETAHPDFIFDDQHVQQTGSLDALILPYGHAAPIVQLLNQPPFVDFICGILVDTGFHAGLSSNTPSIGPRGEDGTPWEKAYLRNVDAQYPGVSTTSLQLQDAPLQRATPSDTSFTRIPHSEPLDACLLSTCVDMYSCHIQALYPIMPLQQLGSLVTRFLRRYELPGRQQNDDKEYDPIQRQVDSALEYLVFALGSVCCAKWDKTIFESGPGFYAHAKRMLLALSGQWTPDKGEHATDPVDGTGIQQIGHSNGLVKNKSSYASSSGDEGGQGPKQLPHSTGTTIGATSTPTPTLDLARAYLLAALFCGQLAWLQDAADHVRKASNIIHLLILLPGGTGGHGAIQGIHGLSLINYKKYPHMLAEDERQLVSLYWTCVQLEL